MMAPHLFIALFVEKSVIVMFKSLNHIYLYTYMYILLYVYILVHIDMANISTNAQQVRKLFSEEAWYGDRSQEVITIGMNPVVIIGTYKVIPP